MQEACSNCGCHFESYKTVIERFNASTRVAKLKKTFVTLTVTTMAGEYLPLCHECRVHLSGLYAEAVRQIQHLN